MAVTLNRELRKFVTPEFITGDNSRIFAGRYATNFHLQKILLATSSELLKLHWMDDITSGLTDAGVEYEIFDEILVNPRDTDVMKGSEYYMAEECTGIVAVGGGSVIDCAKGIGIVSANKGHITDYIGVDLVKNPMPPLICVPTTAGSSADVSQYAVITTPDTRQKNLIISKSLVPDVSLLDTFPLMTQPDDVTINSGIDAFTHAIEAYVSNGSSYYTDIMALEAIKQTGEAFPYDLSLADDPDFRFRTLLSSLYAGISFSNAGLGLIHSMSHSIGGMFDLPHGLASSVVMDVVIRYNYQSAPEKYKKIAETLSVDTAGKSGDDIIELLLEKISLMSGSLGKENGFNSIYVSEEDRSELVRNTIMDPCIATNPRVPDKNDIGELFRHVLDGT